MKLKIVVLSLFISFGLFSQIDLSDTLYKHQNTVYRDSLRRKGIFLTLEEANNVNADSVKFLELGNSSLKEFPMQVLKFKNLEILGFTDGNIAQIELGAPWKLTKEDKEKLYKIQDKYPDIRTDVGIFPIPRKNKIKKIPNEIVQLEKLEFLALNKRDISKRELKRLKKLLPKCTIILL